MNGLEAWKAGNHGAVVRGFLQKKTWACARALRLLIDDVHKTQIADAEERKVVMALLIIRLCDDGIWPEQRMACKILLDYLTPEWGDEYPGVYGAFIERDSSEVREWRGVVMERDGYLCRACGSPDELHAHHVEPWAKAPALRVEAANGVTLCRDCHVLCHSGKLHGWH